ncbi:hypothetical protein [Providencia stuartii]|uniref:hypothetical protein n=1 Tax=Providencia stuartii TaxID=588 RepID=UPI00300DABA9
MRPLSIILLPFLLSGCITINGPVKNGSGVDQPSTTETSTLTTAETTTTIGNRHPDEIFIAVTNFYTTKGLTPIIQNKDVGIIATSGDNLDIAGEYLDCDSAGKGQNMQESYRIVTQVWSSGEGTNVSIQVNGIYQLVTPDGNDKVKPTACKSSGAFESALLQILTPS